MSAANAHTPDPCRIQIGRHTFDFDWNAPHGWSTPMVNTNAWRLFAERVMKSEPSSFKEFNRTGLSYAMHMGKSRNMPFHEWLLRVVTPEEMELTAAQERALFGTPVIPITPGK